MKYLIFFIMWFVTLFISAYVVGVYVSVELNPFQWEAEGRAAQVLFPLLFSLATTAIKADKDYSDPNKMSKMV